MGIVPLNPRTPSAGCIKSSDFIPIATQQNPGWKVLGSVVARCMNYEATLARVLRSN